MTFRNTQHFTWIFALLIHISSFSQTEKKVIGTWAFSGNNVYLYDFADSGKVSITNCENIAAPTVITDGWRITGDSLFHLKEKKKNTYREHTFKIIEINNAQMVLNYPQTDFRLVFYKIEPENKSRAKLLEDMLVNQTFSVTPTRDTLISKISFSENGICTLHEKSASGEVIQSESRWNLLHREDNIFLMMDDFEILVFKSNIENNSEFEFISYGYYRVAAGIESIRLMKVKE